MIKDIFTRIKRLEKALPPLPTKIETSFMDLLESMGYSIKERITDNRRLDYGSQSSFDKSVVRLLTTPELRRLAEQYPLIQ